MPRATAKLDLPSSKYRFAKALLPPAAYFGLASLATLVSPGGAELAICVLAGFALAVAMSNPVMRDLARLQWARLRAAPLTTAAAILAGGLFYVFTFLVMQTDPTRIRGWHFELEYLLLSRLAIPFVEEFLFRCVAIGNWSGRDAWIAASLSGICFAALHPDRWLGTFIFSLVAAAFYLRGGLGAAWGFHAAYNLSNYAALLFFSARNG